MRTGIRPGSHSSSSANPKVRGVRFGFMCGRISPRDAVLAALALIPFAGLAHAQGNYEIQVYGSETQDPGTTMVELHSNFTIEGSKGITDGVLGTEHQLHETVEITQGLNSWSELGFYIFTSAQPGQGWQWVGDHIRPRVRVPDAWK